MVSVYKWWIYSILNHMLHFELFVVTALITK
jgi:hypothetical protein